MFEEFDRVARNIAAKTAIFFRDGKELKTISYKELYLQVIRLGNLLRQKGVKEQDKAVILLGNQPEWPETFFAVQYNGAICVPIDINLAAEEIKALILHSQARIVVSFEKLYFRLQQQLDSINGLQVLLVDSPVFQDELAQSTTAASGKSQMEADDKVAAMFFTSGTTKLPKGVLLSQKNLYSNNRSIKKVGLLTSKDVVISLLPLHHTYSFMVTCLSALLEGAQISYPASLNSEDLISCLKDTKVTLFVGVPQVFLLFHRGIEQKLKKMPLPVRMIIGGLIEFSWLMRRVAHINLSKIILGKMHKAFGKQLKYMVTGGARLDPNVIADFYKWGFTVLEGYGLTETSPVVTFNPPEKPKFGSVGRAIADVEVKILSPDEQGIGEVIIRGPNVMLGYYELPDETARKLKEGWYYTGDLGYLDKEGYLYITGRKDELLVLTSGKKVNPEEIEMKYLASPYIKEICVMVNKVDGFLDQVNQLTAVVVPDVDYFRKQGEVNVEQKIKWELDNISYKLSDYKRIKGFYLSKDSLPRTRLGKLMRHRIDLSKLQKAGEGAKQEAVLSSEDEALFSEDFTQKVLSYLSARLKRKVNLADHLELDLGLDSLGRVELLLELQRHLNIQVPEESLTELYYTGIAKELIQRLKPFLGREPAQEIKQEEFLWSKVLAQPLPESLVNSFRLKPLFIDKVITFLGMAFVKLIFLIFFRLKVEGRENLPKEGPCIIYANHTSYLDGLIVGCSLPLGGLFNSYFLGFRQYFMNPAFRWLIKSARLVPIDITYDLVKTMQVCAYILKHSKLLMFFPEGQRSATEETGPFKKGIGVLAKELNVPLIPIYIEGSYNAWSRHQKFPRPARIKVTCGKVLTAAQLTAEVGPAPDIHEALAVRLRKELTQLKQA